MLVYFAHPVSDYGSERQFRAIAAISNYRNNFRVESPDQPHHQAGYAERGMDYFKGVVERCQGLAFMRFPDGGIGAGVGREIRWALIGGLWLYEVFEGRVYPLQDMPTPILSVEDTRRLVAHFKEPSPC